jgi:uncharacterized protein (DUF433 family)
MNTLNKTNEKPKTPKEMYLEFSSNGVSIEQMAKNYNLELQDLRFILKLGEK